MVVRERCRDGEKMGEPTKEYDGSWNAMKADQSSAYRDDVKTVVLMVRQLCVLES
jgi:hypothetical protein